MSADECLLAKWRAHIPRNDSERLTDNMKNWQRGWSEHCSDVCCYSSNCGTIRCSACGRSTTNTVPSGDRYVCMDCPLPEQKPDAWGVLQWEEAEYTLCRACFPQVEAAGHPHSTFCLVDGQGRHSVAVRSVPEAHALQLDDFVAYTKLDPSAYVGKTCAACWDVTFDEQTPPAVPFGCLQGDHPQLIPLPGSRLDYGYFCRDCEYEAARAAGRLVYWGSVRPLGCRLCRQARDRLSWQHEFADAFDRLRPAALAGPLSPADALAEFARLSSVVQLPALPERLDDAQSYDAVAVAELMAALLKKLHVQPDLQRLVDDEKERFLASL